MRRTLKHWHLWRYLSFYLSHLRGLSKSFRTESITKYTLVTNTRWEATQRVMAAKLTRLTHKIAIQLHLMAESCTICSSRSRRPVRKLLDISSYTVVSSLHRTLRMSGWYSWPVVCTPLNFSMVLFSPSRLTPLIVLKVLEASFGFPNLNLQFDAT
jgi:hypothetical protein